MPDLVLSLVSLRNYATLVFPTISHTTHTADKTMYFLKVGGTVCWHIAIHDPNVLSVLLVVDVARQPFAMHHKPVLLSFLYSYPSPPPSDHAMVAR